MPITPVKLHNGQAGIPWVLNRDQVDQDTNIRGDTDADLVYVDASTDRVGIGTATPTTKLDVDGVVTATGLAITGDPALTGDVTINGALVVNETGADKDTRIESDTNTHAFMVDAGLFSGVGAIGLGGAATDKGAVLIDPPAFTATAATNVARLNIENTAAITVPTGTTAVAASVFVGEPNLTATGTITNAASVYIEAAPTEGGTSNHALFVDAGTTRLDGNLNVADAAWDIVGKANTAAAVEITDGTTSLYSLDTRNTVTVQNHLFDAPASQTLPDGATSRFRNVNIAAHTVTLAGTTQVTTTNQGAQLWIGAPTYAQSGGAVTVDQVSTVHIAAPVAGSSVTITANRMISTSVSDCYLTAAGVWTDTASTEKVKRDIEGLDLAEFPKLLEQIRPVKYRYDAEKLHAFDLDRQRYGIIAEELPEFLRVPGEVNASALSGTILGAFGLAAIRYLHEQNKALQARLDRIDPRGRTVAPGLA